MRWESRAAIDRHRRAMCAFRAVMDVSADERDAALERACQGDADLRSLVERLVEADAQHGGVLDTPVESGERNGASWSLPLPEVEGYRILSRIAEGGMGTVYEAEQERPRRVVALKLLKPGLVSPEALRRFELEGEILARLQHPGIAKVHATGRAESPLGPQPYVAMERIIGDPLTTHAERRGLTTRERVRLLARVADAVEHAHEHGIVHRDLKPANVIVDGDGQPKVLDFGVARASDPDLHPATFATNQGQILGTLDYMAPEQAMGEPGAVDRRADVYALGTLLYEMLSGRLPHELRGQPLPLALRTIHDADPPRLQARDRRFRGDLDTIVHKALERSPSRRYPTAAAMASDLRRFLDHKPIEARPPTGIYTLSKFVRRHRVGFAAASLVFVSLIVGSIVAVRSALEEARHRRRAEAEVRLGHASQVALLLEMGREEQSRELLEGLPHDATGWEWRHLRARANRVVASTDLPPDAVVFKFAGHIHLVGPGGSVHRWDLDTQRLVEEKRGDDSGSVVGAVTRDGTSVLMTDEADLVLRDWRSRAIEGRATGRGALLRSAYRTWLSPEGRYAAIKRVKCGELWLVDLQGDRAALLAEDAWNSACFDAASRRVAFRRQGEGVELWDTDPPTRLWHRDAGHADGLTFTPDSEELLIVDKELTFVDGTAAPTRSWDAETLGSLTSLRQGDASFSPRGTRLVVGGGLLDARSGKLLLDLGSDHRLGTRVWLDERTLVYHSLPRPRDREGVGTLRAHDVAYPNPRVLEGATHVYHVGFDPTGSVLWTSEYQGAVRLWSVDDGRLLKTLDDKTARRCELSADGSALYVRTPSALRILDAISGAVLRERRLLRFRWVLDPKGRRLVVSSTTPRHSLRVLDARTLEDHGRLSTLDGPSNAMASSPDGRWIAVVLRRGGLTLLDAETGEIAASVPGSRLPTVWQQGLDFSPDSRVLAVGDDEGRLELRAVPSLRLLQRVQGASDHIHALAFSPDGLRLAVGSHDGLVTLWDPSEPVPMVHLPGHADYVHTLAWSPDGTRLASGSGDGTVRIWDSVPRARRWREARRAKALRPRALEMVEQWIREEGSLEGAIRRFWAEDVNDELRGLVRVELTSRAGR